jgi:hypothetical protein
MEPEKVYCKCGESFDSMPSMQAHWNDPNRKTGLHYRVKIDGSDYFIESVIKARSIPPMQRTAVMARDIPKTYNPAEWEDTLGQALTKSLVRYLIGNPERVTPIERAMQMFGYSNELKRLIVRCIEVNPAQEESFLLIAELAFRDGEEAND